MNITPLVCLPTTCVRLLHHASLLPTALSRAMRLRKGDIDVCVKIKINWNEGNLKFICTYKVAIVTPKHLWLMATACLYHLLTLNWTWACTGHAPCPRWPHDSLGKVQDSSSQILKLSSLACLNEVKKTQL